MTLDEFLHNAPGKPGATPRWFSSAKCGIGTTRGHASRVWFTLSRGIVSEVFYPEIDVAAIRDIGLLVTDTTDPDYFADEQTDAEHEVAWLEPGVPAFRLTNSCRKGRWRIVKIVICDPRLPVLLQRIEFTALEGSVRQYRLHALLAPHLGDQGGGNSGWIGDYKGAPALFAQRAGVALALLAHPPLGERSTGYVGVSDGWQDLHRHKRMVWHHRQAADGNVALTGALPLPPGQASRNQLFTLALGFGTKPADAAQHALASLQDGFDDTWRQYRQGWCDWHRTLPYLQQTSDEADGGLVRVSAAVLSCHESKAFIGAMIASLSEPWGFARGDQRRAGYHVVWPRDLCESAGGLLVLGDHPKVRQVLHYLQSTQEADGHWPQNMWLSGEPQMNAEQMDETAFPILLTDLARRCDALASADCARLWPMVRAAAGYLVRNGPSSKQDRWEANAGFAVFTVASEIAALLAAADLAEPAGEPELADYLRATADDWHDAIDAQLYATGTALAREAGVDGYYVRIAPPGEAGAAPLSALVKLKNRPKGDNQIVAAEHVSVDALALVRFGLRAPDDPRIVNTIRVLDATLKVETPHGPVWRRYNGDGYGERADGSPFDETGIGRGWPLLTGERGHFEVAAGRAEQARQLLTTMAAFAGDGGMLPEQVWDSPDIEAHGLRLGRPSGSAMPLVWAHAEYLKLHRSVAEGRVFDLPPQPVERYLRQPRAAAYAVWRFGSPIGSVAGGQTLRIETLQPAHVRWSSDGWRTQQEEATRATGLGTHLLDLPAAGGTIDFTFYWPMSGNWEGRDFSIERTDRPNPLTPEPAWNTTISSSSAAAPAAPRSRKPSRPPEKAS